VLTWFPDLRSEAERPDFTAYSAFLELRPRVAEAHLAGDTGTLRRIYGFAERCARQKDKDLWNAAGMAFYERLFDSHRSLWPEFVHWLSPRVIADCMGLWESRLSADDVAEVRRLIAERRSPHHHEARDLTT